MWSDDGREYILMIEEGLWQRTWRTRPPTDKGVVKGKQKECTVEKVWPRDVTGWGEREGWKKGRCKVGI